jgi:lysophospholipid acyltransferase (LPLAT)-like uncharacterized protein
MKIRLRSVNMLLSLLGTWFLRLLFLTTRVEVRTVDPEATPYQRPVSRRRFTFCLWHDYIVLEIFGRRAWNLAGLISQHRDGSYLADSARIAGIQPVRGSTSRGGAEAVREILARPDLHLAMTPDGPRGPRRQIKEGVVFIASRSGRPLVPTAAVASPPWEIKGSWTNMLLPRPFSRVMLIAGTPVELPEDLPREQMPIVAAQLQAEMERLESVARRLLAGEPSAADEIARDWATDQTASRRAA